MYIMITVELKNEETKKEFLEFLQNKRVTHYPGTNAIVLDHVTPDKVQPHPSGCVIHMVWHSYTIQHTPVMIRCAKKNTIIYQA
jgi:hypothetical protein